MGQGDGTQKMRGLYPCQEAADPRAARIQHSLVSWCVRWQLGQDPLLLRLPHLLPTLAASHAAVFEL